MIVDIVTLFPEMFTSVLATSILGRATGAATGNRIVEVHFTDPRQFVAAKTASAADANAWQRRQVDDTPYGGGAGMVIRPDPVVAALEHAEAARGPAHKIYLSPSGKPFDQAAARRYASLPHLVLVCGRYEGIDDRALRFVDEEVSIGDYVLSGGELGAMVLLDAVVRLLPGALGNASSTEEESFGAGLLEYPHFTRPAEFRGATVPLVLTSGNHEHIRRWRRGQALLRTRDRRPDLFAKLALTDDDRRLLADAQTAAQGDDKTPNAEPHK